MPKLLKDMEIDEISLVDKGANEGAQVMIFKRDDSADVSKAPACKSWAEVQKYCGEVAQSSPVAVQARVAETFSELEAKKEVQERTNEYQQLVWTLQQSLESIAQAPDLEEDERKQLLEQSVSEFHEAVMTEIVEDSGTEASEAEDDEEYSKRGNGMTLEEISKRLEEVEKEAKELKALNEQLTKRATEAEAKLAKSEDGAECKMEDGSMGVMTGGKCIAKVDKAALPEAVRKQLEDQESAIKKLAEDNAKSAETISKMREDGEVKEAIAKAATLFPKMPVTAAELGPVLRKVQKALTEGEYKTLETAMKAGEAAIEQTMNAAGSDGAGGAAEGSAYAEVEKKAKELQKSDGKLTNEQAIAKVLDQDPILARKVRDEEYKSGSSMH